MFRFRPLALWITAFLCGILCAVYTGSIVTIVISVVIGVLCVLCVAVRRFPYRATLLPLALALVLGIGYLSLREFAVKEEYSHYYGNTATVSGTVTERDASGFTVSVITSSGVAVKENTSVRVYYDFEQNVSPGDRVYCQLSFYDPGVKGYSSGEYLYGSGDVYKVDAGRDTNLLIGARRQLSNVITERFTRSGSVVKAVLMGDRSDIDPILYSAYSAAGISHLLVISGFHMSLLMMSAYFILSATFLGRRGAGIICTLLTLVFSLFVGFTPSVVRAAIMCCMVFIGGTLNYKGDSFTSLFAALGILLIANPYSLFSLSLQLSFLCSLGIISVSPALALGIKGIKNKLLRKTASALSGFVMSASATLFSFPAIFSAFGEFSVISPVTNLISVPVFSIATVLGYIGLVIPPVSHLSDILFDFLSWGAVLVKNSGISTVSTQINGMGIATCIALAALFIIPSVHIKKRFKAFVLCVLCFFFTVAVCVAVDVRKANTYTVVDTVGYYGCRQLTVRSGSSVAFVDNGSSYLDTDRVFKLGGTDIDVYIMLECNARGLSNLSKAFAQAGVEYIYINEKGMDEDVYLRTVEFASRWGAKTETFKESVTVPVGEAYLTAGEGSYIKYGKDEYVLGFSKTERVYLDGKE